MSRKSTTPESSFGPWRFAGLASVYACAALCAGIMVAAFAISHFTANRRFAQLEPLPQLRWQDVR